MIAPAKDGNMLTFSKKSLGQPNHHRRFPSASYGEIPHTNDCAIEPLLLEPTPRIEPCTQPHQARVQNRKRPQQNASEQWQVHWARLPRNLDISARTRSVAPRLLSTKCFALSPIFCRRSGSRSSSIQATPASSGLST